MRGNYSNTSLKCAHDHCIVAVRTAIFFHVFTELSAEEDAFFDAIPDDGTAPYQIYTQACARLNTRPVKCIYDALKKQLDRVPCKSLVLKRNDVQACTIALVVSFVCVFCCCWYSWRVTILPSFFWFISNSSRPPYKIGKWKELRA